MKKVIQNIKRKLATARNTLNNSPRRVILDTRKGSANNSTCRVINAAALGLVALGSLSLSSRAYATGTAVDFSVTIPNVPVLEIVLSGENMNVEGNTSMTVTPAMASTKFATTDITVKVGTSNTSGYTLNMYSSTSALVSGNNRIESIASTSSCSVADGATCSFAPNSWGYRLSTDTANSYKSIPTAEAELKRYTAGAIDADPTTLTFGTRINAQQPAGTYSTTLNFIATANFTGANIGSVSTLQDFYTLSVADRASVISSMDTGVNYTKTDTRDNQIYTIAKLADGNVWMTKNLNLGALDSSPLVSDLISANTNIGTSTTVAKSTFNGWKKTSGTGTYTAAEYITVPGTDETANIPYGTLYNYCAASAQTICTSSNSSDASYDLCPAGWRLPTGGSSGEFKTLYNNSSYNSNAKMRASIANGGAAFALAGYFDYSTPTAQGSSGNYWSSTRSDGSRMYYLYLDTSGVYPANNGYRDLGRSIRCILDLSQEVTINFAGTGVSSVAVTDAAGNSVASITSSGSSLRLSPSKTYTLTATFASGYQISSWAKSSGSGTLTWTSGNTATFTPASSASASPVTLTLTGEEKKLYLQDATFATCTTTAATAYDNRDEQAYTIQRLADGRCWMMTNLNLGATTLSTNLTSSNTNLSTTITASTFNAWNRTTSGNATAYDVPKFSPVSGTDSTSGTAYGTLYNYCAASANTYCYANNASPEGTNATYDLCPAGWRLPTGDFSGEFGTLYKNSSYNSNAKMRASIANGGAAFALAGYFRNSTPTNQGNYGYYWSSTRNDGSTMYRLYLDASSVYPATGYDRGHGCSIRCILNATS